jgi:hypothetical protein
VVVVLFIQRPGRWRLRAVLVAYLTCESYVSKRLSGIIRGNLSTYIKSLLRLSLVTVAMSTMSLLSVNTQRSPEFTLLRLSRQKGHDWDLDRLQIIATEHYVQLWLCITLWNEGTDNYWHGTEKEMGTNTPTRKGIA